MEGMNYPPKISLAAARVNAEMLQEVAPEDYLMSMVWKRTPAGDFAFNQCPMNATGNIG